MKRLINGVMFIFFILMIGCKPGNKNVSNMSEVDIKKWIASSEWYTGLSMTPDASINQSEFASQVLKNEKSWQAAFYFLDNNNLDKLAIGRYELLNDGTYATVSDYITKEPDSARYEAHRKYIDIQYVLNGSEYIDLLRMADINEEAAYDEKSDILFFTGREGQRLLADKKRFFVFFPDDVHKPCLKVVCTGRVRKIVVKIPLVD